MPPSNAPPQTWQALAHWMQEHYVNRHAFRLGNSWPELADGFALTKENGRYLFFYVERGQRSGVESFESEAEACARAWGHLVGDKWSRAHLIGFFPTAAEAEKMIRQLTAVGIPYETDHILYSGPDDWRYRVFIFGKDIEPWKNQQHEA